MSDYILAPYAQEDLANIRDFYLEAAGERVARQILQEFVNIFQTLARNPGIGHRRQDLVGERQLLFWLIRDFLVIYQPGTKPLEVVTIVRGSRDVPTILENRSR